MSFQEQEFSFTIHGSLCPNNLVTRHYRGISVKNPRAVEDQKRVANEAKMAADLAIWKIAEENDAIAVHIVAYNPRGGSDIDGRPKVILDGLTGIAYDDDKRIKRLLVEDRYDWEDQRYTIHVMTMPMPERPIKPKRIKFEDLSLHDLELLVQASEDVFDPNPGILVPLNRSKIPTSWQRRARSILSGELP